VAHATRLNNVKSTNASLPLVFFQFSNYDPSINQRRDTDFAARVILGGRGNKTGKEAGDAPGFQEIDHAGLDRAGRAVCDGLWLDNHRLARFERCRPWGIAAGLNPDDLDLRPRAFERRGDAAGAGSVAAAQLAVADFGPTVLGRAREGFGVKMPQPDLRGQVLDSENFDPSDIDAGSFIWALASVAQQHGVQTHGLYEADGAFHHWTPDDIRTSVRAGQPVIVQVLYRALPGREGSGYYGDHYVIITGLLGDDFLYNDPIGGAAANESPGYDRVMTPTELQHAMRASDTPYAFSAFGVSRY